MKGMEILAIVFSPLIAQLDHSDFRVREKAMQSLSTAPIYALPFIQCGLQSKSAEVRARLAKVYEPVKYAWSMEASFTVRPSRVKKGKHSTWDLPVMHRLPRWSIPNVVWQKDPDNDRLTMDASRVRDIFLAVYNKERDKYPSPANWMTIKDDYAPVERGATRMLIAHLLYYGWSRQRIIKLLDLIERDNKRHAAQFP